MELEEASWLHVTTASALPRHPHLESGGELQENELNLLTTPVSSAADQVSLISRHWRAKDADLEQTRLLGAMLATVC